MPVSAQTSIFPPPTLIHCDLQCKCNKTQSNIPSKNRLWQHNYRFPIWTVLKCDSGGHIELEKTRSPLQEISLTTDVTSRSVKSRIKDKQGKKLTSLTGNFTSRSRIKDAHWSNMQLWSKIIDILQRYRKLAISVLQALMHWIIFNVNEELMRSFL